MKTTGKKDLDSRECGYAPAGPDTTTCDKTAVIHAMFEDTWEIVSFGSACADHAHIIRAVADFTHNIDEPCHDLAARFLVRTDSSSFCYSAEDDAALQARITQPDIALVGPPK